MNFSTQYIGVKKVEARFMSKGEFAALNGKILETHENPDQEGYQVEYIDDNGQTPNYVSWSPKEVFEKAYRHVEGLTFGLAIEAAKKGHKIARAGWNGKNMFVVYMPPLWLPPYNTQEPGPKVNDRTAKYIGEDTPLDCQPYFAMFNAQRQWIPGWVASQSDMLAEDWMIVE